MLQAPAQNGEINSLCDAGGGIPRFAAQFAAQAERHERRNQRDGKQRGEDERQRLGPGQRTEHAAFLRFKQKHRQKRHHNNDERVEERRPNLLRRADEDAAPLCFVWDIGALGQMAVSVLHHDDRSVDEDTDG